MRIRTIPASKRGTGYYVLYDAPMPGLLPKSERPTVTEVMAYRPTLETARAFARHVLRRGSPFAAILQPLEYLRPKGKD